MPPHIYINMFNIDGKSPKHTNSILKSSFILCIAILELIIALFIMITLMQNLGLWSIGQDLPGLSDKFKEAKKEKKEAVLKLFGLIADVLKDTDHKLLNHVYPAGNCQQLLMYGNE